MVRALFATEKHEDHVKRRHLKFIILPGAGKVTQDRGSSQSRRNGVQSPRSQPERNNKVRLPSPRKLVELLRPRRRTVTIVAAAITILVASAGLARASIPDPAGVIHGCRTISSGAIRIIDSATQTCTNKETPLNWNQTGP